MTILSPMPATSLSFKFFSIADVAQKTSCQIDIHNHRHQGRRTVEKGTQNFQTNI